METGLVDIGIIDENRKLTEAKTALLEISQSNDFSSDNFSRSLKIASCI